MKMLWHFPINQFLNVTITNYKRMLKLNNEYDAYLYMRIDSNPSVPDQAMRYNCYLTAINNSIYEPHYVGKRH